MPQMMQAMQNQTQQQTTPNPRVVQSGTASHISSNQARLQQISPRVQAKLEIGAVNDPLEHEADQAADKVMRMPEPALQISPAPVQISRKCNACAQEDHDQLRMKPAAAPPHATQAPASVSNVLQSRGQPLAPSARAYFEPRFGRDFSTVRVHTDGNAAQSASEIGASAYTAGTNIVFAAGRFNADSHGGRHLLAHELAHVVQQGADSGIKPIQRANDPATDRQIECVVRLGGCTAGPDARDGGTPESDIPGYNKTCREQEKTGYPEGNDITPTEEQCKNPPQKPAPPVPNKPSGFSTGEKVAIGVAITAAVVVGAIVLLTIFSGGTLLPVAMATLMTVSSAAAPAAIVTAGAEAGVIATTALIEAEVIGGATAAITATAAPVVATGLVESSVAATALAAAPAVAPAVAPAAAGTVILAGSSAQAISFAQTVGIATAAVAATGATTTTDGPTPGNPNDDNKDKDDKKKRKCNIAPYAILQNRCDAGEQAHHIVADYTLRCGNRAAGMANQQRIPNLPLFSQGPSICLLGHARDEGSEHGIAHAADGPIADLGKANTPKDFAPIDQIAIRSVAGATVARPECGADILLAVSLEPRFNAGTLGRTTIMPPAGKCPP